MYQPFAQASNRGTQRPGQVQQPQQQPLNYQRVYTSQNQNQPSSSSQMNQQIKPSQVVIPQNQASLNGGSIPLGAQNINRQQIYYAGQQQNVSQRPSQYSQQQKPQQYRIVNGSQYSQASTQSVQQPQQSYQQQQQKQIYQQQLQSYQSVPTAPQSQKSLTMYSNSSAITSAQGERIGLIQQVPQQKQQVQYVQPQPQQQQQQQQHKQLQQQQNQIIQIQQQIQQTNQVNSQEPSLQRLFTKIQAINIQLHSLTSAYQQNIQNKRMTVDQLNQQKLQFRMEIENIYNSCRKVTAEYPTIVCLVTRLQSGEVGIRRTNGTNLIEKEINHMISLIEENYLQFVSNKPVQSQQSLIPVTIQTSHQHQDYQSDILNKNSTSVRESTYSTHANIHLKKSTENLKTIIEESREKTIQDKENSNIYSPIVRAFARGRDNMKTNNGEDDQENIHYYGSTHKERLNTSPDRLISTENPGERISTRLVNTPSTVVQNSRNPFAKQQTFQRQYTFNPQQTAQQARLNGSNFVQVQDHYSTQPDYPAYEPMFKDLYNETEQEIVKRSSNNVGYALSPNPIVNDNKQRLSTVPEQHSTYDQFKQVKNLNQMLKDTQQFQLNTTSKDLQQLMDDQKYEQVTEYAYKTLTDIDRQVINMKATVEQALEQTELTMTKNLLLEIIESLRLTVKNKEIDISHRVVSKIQKNTARLLKDKTASYSLYLYLQKITNFLKERENILNQSIQANEMSLLNQTDHSFWSNNRLDNNDPTQIMPIIEKAKSNAMYNPSSASSPSGTFNFQFFLRENLNVPSYVPMREQQRMQEEVRQSIQCSNSISVLEPVGRSSISPIQQNSTSQNHHFYSAQKPNQFQSKITESITSQQSAIIKIGTKVPDYVPLSVATGSAERPQSAQGYTVLGYRSSSNNILQGLDILNSNTNVSHIFAGNQENIRGNKFQSEDELVKRAQSIPARIFTGVQEEVKHSPISQLTPSQNMPINEEFAHSRKLIKAQFTQSPNQSSQSITIKKQEEQQSTYAAAPVITNTPSTSERKIIQIQRIAQGSNNVEQNVANTGIKNNYSINHLMTPGNRISHNEVKNCNNNSQSFNNNNMNNNTTNLDSILNKYRVVDIEREIKVNNLSKNMEVSSNQNDQIIHSQVEGVKRNEEEVIKRSAPHPPLNNYVSEEYTLNRENNPNLAVANQKNNRLVNLQYESIIEKYIPQNNDKSQVAKQGLSQTSRPLHENVSVQNNQSLTKNYSTQNILTSVNQLHPIKQGQVINNNDPLQSVQTKYDIIVNQQQESLQRTSMNFNIQQMQKKFYDIALKVKGEYPKNHKANTILVNQMWEVAQTMPESQWQDYVVKQCNAAK